jgi:hypothetical protein
MKIRKKIQADKEATAEHGIYSIPIFEPLISGKMPAWLLAGILS